MAFDEPEETQLIDLDDEDESQEATVIQSERDRTPRPRTTRTTPPEAPAREPSQSPTLAAGELRIASFAERFAAFAIDSALLWLLYWASVHVYSHLARGEWNLPAPTNLQPRGLAFHGGYFLLCFLYYFLCEGLFTTTVGKFCCGLTLRTTQGRIPSLSAIAIRNLFRLVDYLFLPIAILVMESTAHHQRSGDVLARTVVLKKSGRQASRAVAWDHIASASGRLGAGVVDVVVLASVLIAGLGLLNDEALLRSAWLLLAGPWVLLFGWAALQRLSGSTPGLWLLGYTIVRENGAPLGFAQALLRTILIPLDALGLGVFAMLFSPRRQRLGDLVAGTLVINSGHSLRGFLGTLVAGACLGLLVWGTWHNPRRPYTWQGQLNPEFTRAFIPRTELAPNWPPVHDQAQEPFSIKNFRFAKDRPDNTLSQATYVPGDMAWFVFEVYGFARRQKEVWIQEDLAIRYPDNSFGLRQENIIEYKQTLRQSGPLELKNNIHLPQGFPSGRYTIYITVRDKLAEGQPLIFTETFYVKDATAGPSLEGRPPQTPPTPTPPAPSAPTIPSLPALQ